MLLVNLFGVPSSGKSTGAAYIFSRLKMLGINAELVTEFAKDKVWEESKEAFNNQAYIFGEQYFRLTRVQNKVDVVITDSPLLLSVFYNNNNALGNKFNEFVIDIVRQYDALNILLERDKPYNPTGRFQDENESQALQKPLVQLLNEHKIPYISFKGNEHDYNRIVNLAIIRLAIKGRLDICENKYLNQISSKEETCKQ